MGFISSALPRFTSQHNIFVLNLGRRKRNKREFTSMGIIKPMSSSRFGVIFLSSSSRNFKMASCPISLFVPFNADRADPRTKGIVLPHEKKILLQYKHREKKTVEKLILVVVKVNPTKKNVFFGNILWNMEF